MSFWNRTYGAGWRCGMVPQTYNAYSGSRLTPEEKCPFTKKQFISRHFWMQGYHEGLMNYLSKRLMERNVA